MTMGCRVYQAANEPKRIEIFPEGAHCDLFDHGAWRSTLAFLASFGTRISEVVPRADIGERRTDVPE
jgi:hypothetical protein